MTCFTVDLSSLTPVTTLMTSVPLLVTLLLPGVAGWPGQHVHEQGGLPVGHGVEDSCRHFIKAALET